MKKTSKGNYVDGFVLVVPKNKLAVYKKMAIEGKKMWMKAGALDYKECVGDDMNPSMGDVKLLTFPELTKLKPTEVAVFSYIVYKSRKHRDQVNAKVMKGMEKDMGKQPEMPFDMKRMAYGGFKVIVSA